jgi:hypothetical protein
MKSHGKASPVTGRETSRLPHFLDNRLTDGGEVVSFTRPPPFTPQEDSCYSFLLEAESEVIIDVRSEILGGEI